MPSVKPNRRQAGISQVARRDIHAVRPASLEKGGAVSRVAGKVQVSVARYLRTPPCGAIRKGLDLAYSNCLRSQSESRSTVVIGNCDLGPITVVPHRAKAGLFERPSILFRPHCPPMHGILVEPPGTAPGSEPSITGAFIAIVPVARNRLKIGRLTGGCKGADAALRRIPPCGLTGAVVRCATRIVTHGCAGLFAQAIRLPPCERRARMSGRAAAGPSDQAQKPALICSNSFTILSRSAGSSGVWARSVPSTGSTKAAFRSSGGIFDIDTVSVVA